MKKIKNYALLIMIALGTSMSFVACSDDDENSGKNGGNGDNRPGFTTLTYDEQVPIKTCINAFTEDFDGFTEVITKAGFTMNEDTSTNNGILWATFTKGTTQFTVQYSVEKAKFIEVNYEIGVRLQTKSFKDIGDIGLDWLDTHLVDVAAMNTFFGSSVHFSGNVGYCIFTGQENLSDERDNIGNVFQYIQYVKDFLQTPELLENMDYYYDLSAVFQGVVDGTEYEGESEVHYDTGCGGRRCGRFRNMEYFGETPLKNYLHK